MPVADFSDSRGFPVALCPCGEHPLDVEMGAPVLGVESMIVVEVPGTGDQIPEGLGSIGRKSEILDISDGVCQSRFSESKRKREEAEEGF